MNYHEILENTLKGYKYINKNTILDFIEKCCFPFPENDQTSEKDHFINNVHIAIASLYEARIEKEQDEIKHLEMEIKNYKGLLQKAYNKGYKPDYLK